MMVSISAGVGLRRGVLVVVSIDVGFRLVVVLLLLIMLPSNEGPPKA
jgi:hypothetical protein